MGTPSFRKKPDDTWPSTCKVTIKQVGNDTGWIAVKYHCDGGHGDVSIQVDDVKNAAFLVACVVSHGIKAWGAEFEEALAEAEALVKAAE